MKPELQLLVACFQPGVGEMYLGKRSSEAFHNYDGIPSWQYYPPFLKEGRGDLANPSQIPLNPPLGKGDLHSSIMG